MDAGFESTMVASWPITWRRGGSRVILLLHGLTGDEYSMTIFGSRLPKEATLIAPRALHPAADGGYSWLPQAALRPGNLADYQPSVLAVWEFLSPANFPELDLVQVAVIGFSQGAALAYAMALAQPDRVKRLACLAGFIPAGAEAVLAAKNHPLQNLPAFVAHGSRDEVVPLAKGQQARDFLQQAGAEVSYCEDAVAHKLSAGCFRGLDDFFATEG
jgi:phospholipase/carboxylesterase